jgi:hypothetical protein
MMFHSKRPAPRARGGPSEQRARAEASARYVDWPALRAREHGVPVIEPRPWSTALDRLCAALER